MSGADPAGGGSAAGDDAVLPFQLDRLDLRGRLARLDAALNAMLSQHAYPDSLAGLLGEAALITALVGQAMKLDGRFSLQARGDGPVTLLATDYFAPEAAGAPARLRAYAQFDPARTPAETDEAFALLGQGVLAMTIDQGAPMKPYQGLTPLVAGGLAASAETYFAQSEQIATRFRLAVARVSQPGGAERWRAGGVMLQHLAPPGEAAERPAEPTGEDGLMSAADVAEMSDRAEDWGRATLLLDTAEEAELIGPVVTPERLLLRLFHEEAPRVFPAAPLSFGCTCSERKLADVLASYPDEELRGLELDGVIQADCQWCGAVYRFTAAELIRRRAAP
ncbi:MAG: Hsp33 family molecular chaperone HslO [Pseudomonadota bacterium]